MEAESFGSLMHWTVALSVVGVALVLKFFTKGTTEQCGDPDRPDRGLSGGAGLWHGQLQRRWPMPAGSPPIKPLPYGFEFSLGAVIAVTLVSIVSAIETVGDASATTKAGAGARQPMKRLQGQPMPTDLARLLPVSSAACPTPRSARTSALSA